MINTVLDIAYFQQQSAHNWSPNLLALLILYDV